MTQTWSCADCGSSNQPVSLFCTTCGSRNHQEVDDPGTAEGAPANALNIDAVTPGRPPPLQGTSRPVPAGNPAAPPPRTGLSGVAWATIGALGILVVAGSVVLVLLLTHSSTNAVGTDQSGTATRSTTPASAGSGSSGARSGSVPIVTTAPGNSGTGGSGQAPPNSASPTGGWTQYSDTSTGFTIWYPTGWTVDPTTDGVFFRDPGVNAYLLVAYITPAGPSALGAWQQQEPTFASNHSDYNQVSMSGDAQQATWEYMYSDDGTEMHGVDWGAVVDSGQYGFALNWVTDEGDWADLQPGFQAMKQSFVAPGG